MLQPSTLRVACYLLCIAVVYIVNGELLQHLEGAVSPLVMLWTCHVVGLLFLPVVVWKWDAVRAELNESFAVGTFILSFLLMSYNYAWITASAAMPVALVNLLFQTSIAFTYVLSACVGLESVTGRGVGAVGMALGGVLLASSGLNAPTTGGVALALLAAVGQSVYQISWKGFFMSRPANWLFFVTCGCAVAMQHLLLLPGIAMIGYMSPLQLPNAQQLPLVLLAATLAFTVNALTVLVIAEAGPVVLAVGSTASIPIGFLLDFLLHGQLLHPRQTCACLLIVTAMGVLLGSPKNGSGAGREVEPLADPLRLPWCLRRAGKDARTEQRYAA